MSSIHRSFEKTRKSKATKRSARNSSIVPSRKSVHPFVIKAQFSDCQNLGAQGHVTGLFLSALISTSVLITVAAAAL